MYHDRQLKLLLLAGVASMRDNTAFSRIYLVSNNSLQRRIKISPSSFKSHEMELPLSRFLILRVDIFNHCPTAHTRTKKRFLHFYIIVIRLLINCERIPSPLIVQKSHQESFLSSFLLERVKLWLNPRTRLPRERITILQWGLNERGNIFQAAILYLEQFSGQGARSTTTARF